jgi:hypothetical protein
MNITYSSRVSSPDVAALRRRSRSAFGQDYQLEVMLEISDTTGTVNLTDIADRLSLTTSQVQSSWKRLIAIDLLEATSRDQRTKFYRKRTSSPAWKWARELAGDLWVRD